MPMDYTGGSGWYVYNPEYNAPMTAAELDLFKRLQSGDPVLQQQYKDKYGLQGCVMYDPAGCAWLNQWGRDQDYWNARYLNQLAPPEEMAALQKASLTPQGYPYTIHQMNAIKQMMAAGTVNAYFAGFTDQNLAGYLAAVVGISLTNKQNDLTIGLQPPTWNPTSVGQPLPSDPVPYEPPSISGPIPPSPTTTGIQGPTTIQPPVVTGVSPSPSSTQTAMPGGTAQTQPPTVTAVPSPVTSAMPTPTSMLPQQQPNMMLWIVAGVVVLAVVVYAARK